ncbi:hypothetical protein GIY23_04705 [Allosaccharopolyspora coralli]|uniref:Peptidase n=1 Tax=Allosaccharopolyspora coralli TaxID=2665642 RepID=A0A5Q3QCI5_9PSEU|nr:hypothetical protein GIY23_04705 [Allosaccharopolyspora coralli]
MIGIVICAGFLCLLGTAGLAEVADSGDDAAAPSYEPTYGDTDQDTDSTASSTISNPPTSTSETATPSTERPETSTVPPEPAEPEPVYALGNHPFNIPGNGAVETGCDLAAFAVATDAQEAYYQSAAPCLMDMWTPALEEANLPAVAPEVITFDSGSVTNPCGRRDADETAMYCSANHTIYMTASYYRDVEGHTQPGVYLGQFAHEFGHAVQGMTGILNAYGTARHDAGAETSRGLELSRRSELQATCFGGMALASLQNGGVNNNHILTAVQDGGQRGDYAGRERDHGSPANNAAWVNQGFSINRITDCNTWLADDSDVS